MKDKSATFCAHTAGRYQRKRFRKGQVRIKCYVLYAFLIFFFSALSLRDLSAS